MLTKEQKRQQSESLRTALSDISTLFIMENRGLSVNEVNELRSKIRKADASYKVVKNSVVRLAVADTPLEELSEHLTGPNAFAFTSGDGVELAKILRDFAKQHAALSFKQGYLEGRVLPAELAAKVAEMPSRQELLTKLAYLLQSPIRRLAVALNTPVQKLASAVHQIAEQKN